MGKYQAYPIYKDSDVIGLDKIPAEWSIKKIKYLFNIGRGRVISQEELVDEGEFPVYSSQTANDGCLGYISTYDFDCEQITWTTDGANAGTVFLRKGKHNCTNVCGTLQSKSGNQHLRFSLYCLQYVTQFYKRPDTNGAKIMNGEMAEIMVTEPLGEDKTTIANFLDHETAKIDTLIEKQQQLIQLLKEKRQAVISHAVTKGLNPNAPMKDSGVEWLGEVPEHWEVLQLKHTCALIKDGTHLPPPRVDIGIPLLSVRNIIDGKFVFREDDSNISEYDFEVLCKSFIPAINDVVLAIVGATLGKVALIESMAPFHVQRSVAIFRTKQSKLLPLTLKNIFDSRGFQSLLWEYVGFSAQPGIYLGTLENFQIAVAPADEQLEINAYCSTQSHAIDLLIDRGQKAIALMQERRSALISAAVTGKIDVRDWQAPQN